MASRASAAYRSRGTSWVLTSFRDLGRRFEGDWKNEHFGGFFLAFTMDLPSLGRSSPFGKPPKTRQSHSMKPKFAFVSYRISRRLALPGILPVAVALSLTAPQARAVNGSWLYLPTAANQTRSWSTPGDWTGGTIAGGAAGDIADFATAPTFAGLTVQLTGNRLLGTLNVSPSTVNTFTIAGNGTGGYLFMDGGGTGAAINFASTFATAGANNIYAPIILQDNLEVSSIIAGGQGLRGSITGAFGITVDSNGLHPAGTTSALGDVVLGGVNSFSGGLTATQARVQAGNSRAMGTGPVTVNSGGGVYLGCAGFTANAFVLPGPRWNETTGVLGALRIDANAVFNGNINLDNAGGTVAAARLHAHTTGNVVIRFDGVLSGNANVEFTKGAAAGSATWILNNANTYAGTTTIGLNAGGTGTSILQIGNDNTSGSLNAASVINIGTGGILASNRRDSVTLANTIQGAGGGTARGVGPPGNEWVDWGPPGGARPGSVVPASGALPGREYTHRPSPVAAPRCAGLATGYSPAPLRGARRSPPPPLTPPPGPPQPPG